MNWIEIAIDAHGDPEGLCEQLTELGAESFVIEDETDFKDFLENNTQYWDFVDDKLEQDFQGASRVKFWMADDETGQAMVAQLQKLGMNPQVKHVQDADWENNWRDFYKPMEIGEKLVIVPEWEPYEGDRTPVKLDPGLLFGTGDHSTTQMCLTAVEQYAGPGKVVADIGCGSGILGIAAAVLGSERIVAADVDEKAPEIVRENAALNGVEERFTVYVGDVIASASLRQRLGTGYDLVLANIVADVIIPLAPYVPALMGEDGVFVCSGIIDGREDDVEAALGQAGFAVQEHKHLDEWHCFVCRKEKA
jgi:ribosomal protein L11 methyltransferase